MVQVEVSHCQRRSSGNPLRTANHSKAMVLGGDEHLLAAEVAYRVVATPVTIGELGSCRPVGKPD